MLSTLMPTWLTPLLPGIRFACAPTAIAAPPMRSPIANAVSVRAWPRRQVMVILRSKAYFGFGVSFARFSLTHTGGFDAEAARTLLSCHTCDRRLDRRVRPVAVGPHDQCHHLHLGRARSESGCGRRGEPREDPQHRLFPSRTVEPAALE